MENKNVIPDPDMKLLNSENKFLSTKLLSIICQEGAFSTEN